ncbi:MBL fold metallo-hydrolase, partial [Microcoleus sp. herbarium8]
MSDSSPSQANLQPSDNKATSSNSPLTEFLVQFWGVRGSIATPGTKTIRYGGNTSCVEM